MGIRLYLSSLFLLRFFLFFLSHSSVSARIVNGKRSFRKRSFRPAFQNATSALLFLALTVIRRCTGGDRYVDGRTDERLADSLAPPPPGQRAAGDGIGENETNDERAVSRARARERQYAFSRELQIRIRIASARAYLAEHSSRIRSREIRPARQVVFLT